MNELHTNDYKQFVGEVKQAIQQAQIKAMITVNQQLLQLYWNIGNMIIERQKKFGWGSSVITQLSKDIKADFPTVKGYSERNLGYMKKFATEYHDFPILQTPSAKITWSHNTTLLDKCKTKEERLWYASKAIEYGWSLSMMEIHIDRKLYEREGKAITNFTISLPKPHSDLANQTLKDPYIFDFVSLTENYLEKELEDALTDHIIKFLLELGQGFAFVGRQYNLKADDDDYRVDLLFYHLKLRSYVVIDLKARKFQHEFVGKMNFYVNAIDDLLKGEFDNPTIGIILCKDKDSVKAEYSLRGINTPIGISEFRLGEALPDEIKSNLPSIEDLERKLKDIDDRIGEK
jgi:predicted nuclease of restriction endonuclease-like (RecB) superfamily